MESQAGRPVSILLPFNGEGYNATYSVIFHKLELIITAAVRTSDSNVSQIVRGLPGG
jgi:hypothetical protein